MRRTHPKAQLLFLGRGTAWQEITQAASQLPAGPDGAPAVIMHPAVPAAEAAVWQRGAAAALVSIKPGQGYDFAYPTKVLSALGCGTPVLFAGRGPVSADVRDFDLGWAAEHDAAAIAEAMRTALDTYDAEIASGTRPAVRCVPRGSPPPASCRRSSPGPMTRARRSMSSVTYVE